MTPVVLESPYAGPDDSAVESHLRYLRACMRDCLMRSESPYASHGLYTQPGVLDDTVHDQRELGIRAGYAWWSSAEKMVVYTDLGVSSGMQRAIDRAPAIALPVEFRRLPSHVLAELGLG